MTSKRRYPEKRCSNPECEKDFIPHDKRLKYCSAQCRINTNNDQKSKANKETKYLQKLKQSDAALAFLYTKAEGDQYFIKESDLLSLKVDFTIGKEINIVDTGETLRWYINYGIGDDGNTNDLHYYVRSYEEIEFFEN